MIADQPLADSHAQLNWNYGAPGVHQLLLHFDGAKEAPWHNVTRRTFSFHQFLERNSDIENIGIHWIRLDATASSRDGREFSKPAIVADQAILCRAEIANSECVYITRACDACKNCDCAHTITIGCAYPGDACIMPANMRDYLRRYGTQLEIAFLWSRLPNTSHPPSVGCYSVDICIEFTGTLCAEDIAKIDQRSPSITLDAATGAAIHCA